MPPEMKHELQQKQVLSASQVQSLEMLRMSSTELRQCFEEEHQNNPFLEQTGCIMEEASPFGNGYRFRSSRQPASRGREEARPETGEYVLEEDPRRELLNQLNPRDYAPCEWRAVEYMVECLDENGRFAVPLELVAQRYGLTADRAAELLRECQGLEPAGIFARDLQECLLLQLWRLPKAEPVAERIVREGLQLLAAGKIGRLARQLGISTAQVQQAAERIRSLNPRPMAGHGREQTAYLHPEVSIRWRQGWEITVHDEWRQNYSVSEYYMQLVSTAGEEAVKEYMAEKLRRVQFMMQAAQKRHDTLLEITKSILRRQEAFLRGNGPLVPLSMGEIAEELGLSPSTVSRALKDKYLQGPLFVVPFRALFSAVRVECAQGETTGELVREMLRRLVAEENPASPMSDNRLQQRLQEEGITIGRRTIAKYRAEMGIPDSRERKIQRPPGKR